MNQIDCGIFLAEKLVHQHVLHFDIHGDKQSCAIIGKFLIFVDLIKVIKILI